MKKKDKKEIRNKNPSIKAPTTVNIKETKDFESDSVVGTYHAEEAKLEFENTDVMISMIESNVQNPDDFYVSGMLTTTDEYIRGTPREKMELEINTEMSRIKHIIQIKNSKRAEPVSAELD